MLRRRMSALKGLKPRRSLANLLDRGFSGRRGSAIKQGSAEGDETTLAINYEDLEAAQPRIDSVSHHATVPKCSPPVSWAPAEVCENLEAAPPRIDSVDNEATVPKRAGSVSWAPTEVVYEYPADDSESTDSSRTATGPLARFVRLTKSRSLPNISRKKSEQSWRDRGPIQPADARTKAKRKSMFSLRPRQPVVDCEQSKRVSAFKLQSVLDSVEELEDFSASSPDRLVDASISQPICGAPGEVRGPCESWPDPLESCGAHVPAPLASSSIPHAACEPPQPTETKAYPGRKPGEHQSGIIWFTPETQLNNKTPTLDCRDCMARKHAQTAGLDEPNTRRTSTVEANTADTNTVHPSSDRRNTDEPNQSTEQQDFRRGKHAASGKLYRLADCDVGKFAAALRYDAEKCESDEDKDDEVDCAPGAGGEYTLIPPRPSWDSHS